LTGSSSDHLNSILGSIDASLSFNLAGDGHGIGLTAHVTGGFSFSKSGFGVSGNLNVNIGFTPNSSGGLDASGSGSFDIRFDFPGGSATIHLGYSVSNSGLTLDFPAPFGNITFSW
jgi:hypothetical protein